MVVTAKITISFFRTIFMLCVFLFTGFHCFVFSVIKISALLLHLTFVTGLFFTPFSPMVKPILGHLCSQLGHEPKRKAAQ